MHVQQGMPGPSVTLCLHGCKPCTRQCSLAAASSKPPRAHTALVPRPLPSAATPVRAACAAAARAWCVAAANSTHRSTAIPPHSAQLSLWQASATHAAHAAHRAGQQRRLVAVVHVRSTPSTTASCVKPAAAAPQPRRPHSRGGPTAAAAPQPSTCGVDAHQADASATLTASQPGKTHHPPAMDPISAGSQPQQPPHVANHLLVERLARPGGALGREPAERDHGAGALALGCGPAAPVRHACRYVAGGPHTHTHTHTYSSHPTHTSPPPPAHTHTHHTHHTPHATRHTPPPPPTHTFPPPPSNHTSCNTGACCCHVSH
jgi:hypothetical protein